MVVDVDFAKRLGNIQSVPRGDLPSGAVLHATTNDGDLSFLGKEQYSRFAFARRTFGTIYGNCHRFVSFE